MAVELLACVGVETVAVGSRVMAAVLLKRFTASCRGEESGWPADAVASFRAALCAKMLGERSGQVARQLCHAVAQEAVGGGWPEIVSAAGECLSAELDACEGDAARASRAGVCLSLVKALCEAGDPCATSDAGTSALAPLVARCLAAADAVGDVSAAAVKASCALASACSKGVLKGVVAPQLCGPCLGVVQSLLTRGDEARAVECLDALVDAAADAPTFLAQVVEQLAQLVGAAANAEAFEASTRSRAWVREQG